MHALRGSASSWRTGAAAAAALIAALCSGCAGFEEPALQPVTPETLTRVLVPPVANKSAQFDFMTIDQQHHRIYVSDALDQGVDVIDVTSVKGRFLGTISTPAVPNGVLYVPEFKRVYTGNLDSTVSVIEADPASPHAGTVVKTISTAGDGSTDLLTYDAHDQRLFVTNPDDGFISAIDPATNKVTGRIANLGVTEQPVYDPNDGMLYVGSSDRNSVLQIDPRTNRKTREFAIPVVCVPHGMAIDAATNQGIIGCGDKDSLLTVAWDFGTGRMLQSFDFAGGGDQVIFDEKSQHFYFAAQGFAPPVMAVFNASPITFLTSVPTSHHSNQVAYDETNDVLYTADGRHLEASLWEFPDPVAGCYGREALLASEGAPRAETPHCRPGFHTAVGA